MKNILIIFLSLITFNPKVYADTVTGTSNVLEYQLQKRPKFPPLLSTTLSFDDSRGRKNGYLDASEQAKIVITVKNQGKGDAYNLLVQVDPISSMSNVTLEQAQRIDRIIAGGEQTVQIGIEATEKVPDQTLRLRVSVIEPIFGADALPQVITLETKKLEPPLLKVVDTAIDDGVGEFTQGNGNKQLEINEQVEITHIIQNLGTGEALNLTCEISALDSNVLYQGEKNRFNLGDIAPGEWRKLTYPIYVNMRYKGDRVSILLKMFEARARFSKTDTIRIALNTEIKKPDEVVITGKVKPVTIIPAPPLTVDSVDVDFNIPETKQKNPDAIAVIIGVKNYRQGVPKVEYADNDARIMRQYLIRLFGYADENIIFLQDPTKGDLERVFGGTGITETKSQLANYIKANKSDVFIYYAGHGAPSLENNKPYLVPSDAHPDYVALNGYSLELLYRNLKELPARNITVVIDACFSGQTVDTTNQTKMLIAKASPLVIKPIGEIIPKNITVLTAAAETQVASWYPQKRHSLFTYFFLKGLKGDADKNGDFTITLSEIKNYLDENVPFQARRNYNRQQTPVVTGDLSKILVKIK